MSNAIKIKLKVDTVELCKRVSLLLEDLLTLTRKGEILPSYEYASRRLEQLSFYKNFLKAHNSGVVPMVGKNRHLPFLLELVGEVEAILRMNFSEE